MQNNFKDNIDYKNILLKTENIFYDRYVNDILKLVKKDWKFLDIGCGTGNTLKMLSNFIEKDRLFGVDISEFFLKDIKGQFNVLVYDGKHLPFNNSEFDIVGSFTVLEHTQNPYDFLDENLRVLKKNGYLIIACPNFLSIFNNVRKYSIIDKFIKMIKYIKGNKFEINAPIIRDKFQSDDDAVVVTSIPPIVNYLKSKNIKIEKISGTMGKRLFIKNLIADLPLIRLFLPSCYIIGKKI